MLAEPLVDQVRAVLLPLLGESGTERALSDACEGLGVRPNELRPVHLQELAQRLVSSSAGLHHRRDEVERRLRALGGVPLGRGRSVEVGTEYDILRARNLARGMSQLLGLSDSQERQVVTAAAELARNLVRHAGGGSLTVEMAAPGGRPALRIVAADRGPGIADLPALRERLAAGSGGGLQRVRRIMDDVEVAPGEGGGTTVIAIKFRLPAQTGRQG